MRRQRSGTKVLGTYSHRLSQSMLVQAISRATRSQRPENWDSGVGIQRSDEPRGALASGLTPKDVDYVNVSTKGRVPDYFNQIDTAILHVDQALVRRKARTQHPVNLGNRRSGYTQPTSRRKKRLPATANSA
jgi:hypothetical protein